MFEEISKLNQEAAEEAYSKTESLEIALNGEVELRKKKDTALNLSKSRIEAKSSKLSLKNSSRIHTSGVNTHDFLKKDAPTIDNFQVIDQRQVPVPKLKINQSEVKRSSLKSNLLSSKLSNQKIDATPEQQEEIESARRKRLQEQEEKMIALRERLKLSQKRPETNLDLISKLYPLLNGYYILIEQTTPDYRNLRYPSAAPGLTSTTRKINKVLKSSQNDCGIIDVDGELNSPNKNLSTNTKIKSIVKSKPTWKAFDFKRDLLTNGDGFIQIQNKLNQSQKQEEDSQVPKLPITNRLHLKLNKSQESKEKIQFKQKILSNPLSDKKELSDFYPRKISREEQQNQGEMDRDRNFSNQKLPTVKRKNEIEISETYKQSIDNMIKSRSYKESLDFREYDTKYSNEFGLGFKGGEIVEKSNMNSEEAATDLSHIGLKDYCIESLDRSQISENSQLDKDESAIQDNSLSGKVLDSLKDVDKWNEREKILDSDIRRLNLELERVDQE